MYKKSQASSAMNVASSMTSRLGSSTHFNAMSSAGNDEENAIGIDSDDGGKDPKAALGTLIFCFQDH